MKKLLFGCAIAIFGLSASVASADDYCCPTQYDPCCGVDFDGFYIGGNLGVISHTAHRNDFDGFLTDNSGWTTIDTNVTAGLQLGYDWQCDNTVLGLVVDWNWVNTDHRVFESDDDGNYIRSENRWFTTIRARAGVNICSTLLYLTGGAAVTRLRNEWADLPVSFQHHHSRWGWVGGIGAEFELGCNWTIGAELLFVQFSNRNESSFDGATEFAFGHSDSLTVGRILLNYRFGDLFSCFW